MNIGTLTATLGVDTTGLNRASEAMGQFRDKADSSLASVAQSLDKTGRNIYYFGTASMRFLTLPLAAAGVASFKMAKDFEASMQKIVGLVGVSQQQVDSWSQSLIKLGPSLGQTPKELADALYFITSSGFKGEEALNILNSAAKGATAGLGETKPIADLLTSAMNAYANSNLTAGHAMDVLTAAVREGKGEAPEFAKQMGDVIPIASRMGVSFDQVAAAMASMTLTGTSVAESATYLRQILTTLLDTTPGVTAALRRMGLSAAEMRGIISDQGLFAALQRLNTGFSIYGESIAGKVFPNVRALTGILSLMGERMNSNAILFNKIANSTGSADAAFEAMTNTIEFKYNQALSTAQATLIKFGLALKGPIVSFLNSFSSSLQKLTEWFSNLSQAQQQTILNTGIFLAALGPLSIAVGLLSRGMGGLLIVLNKVVDAFSVMKLFFVANPILAVVGAVTALTGAYLIFHKTATTFLSIQQSVNSKISDEVFKLQDVFAVAKDYTKTAEQRGAAIKVINDRYVEYLGNLLTEKSSLQDIEKAQKSATNALIADVAVKSYRESMQKELDAISNSFNKYFSDFINGYSKTFGPDRVGEFLKALYEGTDNAIKNNTAIEESQKIYDAFVEKMSKKTGYLKYDIEDFRKAFDAFVKVKYEKGGIVSQIETMIASYQKLIGAATQAKTVTKGTGDAGGGRSMRDIDEETRVNKFVLDQLKVKQDIIKRVGEDYETYTNIVKKAGRTESGFTFRAPKVDFETKPIDNYRLHFMQLESLYNPADELRIKLADLAYQNTLLSETFDPSSRKIETMVVQVQYLKSEIQKLWDQGIRPGNVEMDRALSILKPLQEQMYLLQNRASMLSEVGSAFTKMGSAVQGAAGSWLEWIGIVLGGLPDIIKMVEVLTATQMASVAATNTSTAANLANTASSIAQTSADSGAAIAGATKSGAKLPFPANLVAIASGVAAVIVALSSIPKMAKGGIVPSGYGNDTYPALLSSGEMVVPPGKLDDLRGSDAGSGVVEFRIDGYDLVGLFRKHSNKLSKA